MTMYVITHKHFNYNNLPISYVPLLVGADFNPNPDNFLQDNSGENISSRNPSFCELTGLYWMWKNSGEKNLGLSHYRRYFSKFNNNSELFITTLFSGNVSPVPVKKLDSYLDDFDWVVVKPQVGGKGNLWEQFAHFHHEKDMKAVRNVIEELSPEYLSSFDYVMDQSSASFFNMFYTSKKELDKYASWLFPILFKVEKIIDISNYDSYQKRLFGFLGERLFNVWLYHRKAKIKTLVEYNSELVNRAWAARSIKNDILGW
ncbi:DUF4422 domain-containing protein [Limosilactobacillus fastidiosus]|uniref:DUF4422 domain-containing protein n=1 Tax=Limosilactobacillus fastidiosus TaxID=2759855 RepID=A0ABR6E8L3_9LACO|nr:DUF4422 domain-containing protein [Limosilactobacillus fastidiosus]MBB1063534.1 DUF4422 domain-containing protein [Limosilactobacillus fastidiosus]MCD7084885.1 DUF4422 domain-containing protein [Limosilactobacillus fastidiosus]